MFLNRLFPAGTAGATFARVSGVTAKPAAPSAPAAHRPWALLEMLDKTSLLFSRSITTWAAGQRDIS
jgi:hypothetical protein